MTLAALVLAGFVTFTPPTNGMLRVDCCLPDTAYHMRDCYAVVLYVFGQQSAEWAEWGRACLTDPVRWARVVAQAKPFQVSSKAVCPPFVALDSLSYPDSLKHRGRVAFVVTRNAAGGFCWSNVVKLP